ncbi:MAG: hypothetical protein WCR72_18480 [Bacteroidota bacterium]
MADKKQGKAETLAADKPIHTLKKKIRKYLYFALAIFVLIVGLYVYWSFFFTYSDGYRAGMLQKFSRKGNIFKTYEGEMILSSVQSNKNVAIASEKFLFSVSDRDVAIQLEKFQGKNVVVHYTEKNNTLPWRGETVFIVSNVKLSD